MRSGNQPEKGERDTGRTISRRSVLATTGAGLTAVSLAGCTGSLGAGGGGGGTVRIGNLQPLSGVFSAFGEFGKQTVELAIEKAKENDDAGGREIELVDTLDTKADPTTGRQKAEELINDDVDLLVGAFSSSVALSIGPLATQNDVPYSTIVGSLAFTGADCTKMGFSVAPNARLQAVSDAGYAMREGLGESIFDIVHDYAWGHAHQATNKLLAEQYGVEYKGGLRVPFGQGDFSQAYTEAQNSGADIIAVTVFGQDAVGAISQAGQFGVVDDNVVTFSLLNNDTAKQVGQEVIAHENFYGCATWYPDIDAPGATEFTEAFREKYGQYPESDPSMFYPATRTPLKAIAEADSKEPADIVSQMEDMEIFPNFWGSGRYRACDHRGVAPSATLKGTPPSEFDEEKGNYFQVLNRLDDPESHMRTCEETGCNL